MKKIKEWLDKRGLNGGKLHAAFVAGAVLAIGCAPKAKGKSTVQVYEEAMQEGARDVIQTLKEGFKRERPLGYEEPVVPMMAPPETMLIWVFPQRFGEDVFVHGHWVQLVVTPWQWNPEIISNPVSGTGSATSPAPLPLHPEAKPKPQEGQ